MKLDSLRTFLKNIWLLLAKQLQEKLKLCHGRLDLK